ncbi:MULTISPECIES: hypothetical protein [Bradyrhizobium]|uniref:hypothetical protein n=1 Tax=Bradyrhizobium TaxID=374 RepID=UPI000401E18F|nr:MULTISPECIES: hypothetical protein [Bradyrhizobium]UFW46272.1 hypothetical protein BaraCB756_28635 [Bradyrhizobium arachidis]
MIEVVVSENGRVVDRLQFDVDTLVANGGDVVAVHRGAMRDLKPSEDLWQRVAHAAGYLARVRSFKHASRALENFASARRVRPLPGAGGRVRLVHHEPHIEIEDDDLYRLQRDRNECEADYLARCEMLGCNRDGFIRLPRRA